MLKPFCSSRVSRLIGAALVFASPFLVSLFLARPARAQGIINTVAGGGNSSPGDGGPATSAVLQTPTGLAVDSAGNIYIADVSDNRVRKVTPGGTITTVAGNGTQGYSGDGGPATSAELSSPWAVAVDSSGNLYIADFVNQRVRKVSGGIITTVAGNGTVGFSGDGGPAINATLAGPIGVAVDSSGSIYIADAASERIRKVTPDGIINTVAGGGFNSPGNGGPATSALLINPWAVAVDNAGNLYISDLSGYVVRKVTAGIISTVAGNGTTGFSGDGGPATNAQLGAPWAVAVDTAGNLYIADYVNNRVRKVSGGNITTVAGTGGFGFSGDGGPAANATLLLPSGVATDLAGNLYIADTGNARVREVTSGGVTPPPPPALLAVGPSALGFQSIQGVNPPQQAFQIGDTASGTLNWAAQATTVFGGNWLSVNPTSGIASAAAPASVQVIVSSAGLAPGVYSGSVQVTSAGSQPATVAVTLLISSAAPSIFVSQAGLLFTGVQGGGVLPSQTFGILDTGAGTLNWTAQASTISGGNWLSVSPTSGSSASGSTSIPSVTVGATATGLSAGAYAGTVSVSAPSASNSPQLVSAILNVLPSGSTIGASVVPTGLIFATPAGTTSPASKTVTVATANAGTATVNITAATSQGGNWLSASPASLTVTAGSAKTVTVQAALGTLAAGIYTGTLTMTFSDGSPTQTVNVLFVVSSGTPAGSSNPSAAEKLGVIKEAATCTPKQLVTVLQALGGNFASPTAWPTLVQAQVADDCGNSVTNAAVIATFSTGDKPLVLSSLQNGIYSGTWQPATAAAKVTVTVKASLPPLTPAQTQIQGSISANSVAPVVFGGGVVNGASFAAGAPLAPGSIVSVFGSKLSGATAAAPSVPLPTQLSGSTLTVGGINVPLFFSSDGQMNAQLPFELTPNSNQQALVTSGLSGLGGGGGALNTVPQPITISSAAPGIFTVDAQGTGAILNANTFAPITPSAPAAIGDYISIFATGLGALNAPATSGALPPSPPPLTSTTPQVTINNFPAQVSFSGLAPCCVGLYQVNVQVPSGTPSGPQPLQIIINGVPSNTILLPVK